MNEIYGGSSSPKYSWWLAQKIKKAMKKWRKILKKLEQKMKKEEEREKKEAEDLLKNL